MGLIDKVRSGFNKAVLAGSMALLPVTPLAGCYTQTTANSDQSYVKEVSEDDETRSFVGRPIKLMHHTDGDLEFVLESYDDYEQKKYTINVRENADNTNERNLELVKTWIMEASKDEDAELRVEGYYKKKSSNENYERGNLNPFAIVKLGSDNSNNVFEEVVFTDGSNSKIYDEDNEIIIIHHVYTPGHRIKHWHYPFDFRPRWDRDGDGIPNWADSFPDIHNYWIDKNNNGIVDWYDPWIGGCQYWTWWGDYWGHDRFNINIWINFYDYHKHHGPHQYSDWHNDVIKERTRLGYDLRNNLGGRNPGDNDPRVRNPRVKDPFIKPPDEIKNLERKKEVLDIDPIKEKRPRNIEERVEEKDRTRETTRDREKERRTLDDRNKEKDKNKDTSPPIKRDDTRRTRELDQEKKNDTYDPKYVPRDKQKEIRKTDRDNGEYRSRDNNQNETTPPRRDERQYTPRNDTPKQTTLPRRDERQYTPRNDTPRQTTPPIKVDPPPKQNDRPKDTKRDVDRN